MGVNIYLENPDNYAELEGWDSFRYAGDKDFWTNFEGIEFEHREAEGFPYADDRQWIRPQDFSAFRERAASLKDNPQRWLRAADLMEANPDYWLYFSW